jgi:endogenous inhibitor of DNA gyrase (YacG/DUF329 family)
MPAKPPKDAGPGQGKPKGRRPAGKESVGKGSAKKCPICGKPATEASRPFCSERCRDVDLNRWLSNSYAIPGRPEADEDQD